MSFALALSPPLSCNLADWYWVVGGDRTRYWSSRIAAYVAESDPNYQAFLTSGGLPSPIDSEASLKAVFDEHYPAGWPHGAKRYVPVWQLRERLEALSLWEPMVTAMLAQHPADLFKLCTLRDGINPDDSFVRGLLVQLGAADVDDLLAP